MLPLLALLLLPFLHHALAAPKDSQSSISPPCTSHLPFILAPAAASFYVPSIPGIQQDPDHPLTIYAGHLSSEYNLTRLQTNEVTPHLFFVLVKNRRTADRERVIFWFNVSLPMVSISYRRVSFMLSARLGRAWMFVLRRSHDGGWSMADGRQRRIPRSGGWMGGIYHYGLWCVPSLTSTFPRNTESSSATVDQPAGTGFSYTSTDRYVHLMDEVNHPSTFHVLMMLTLSCSPGSKTIPGVPSAIL